MVEISDLYGSFLSYSTFANHNIFTYETINSKPYRIFASYHQLQWPERDFELGGCGSLHPELKPVT